MKAEANKVGQRNSSESSVEVASSKGESASGEALPEGVPHSWCWTTIEDVARVGTGTTPRRGNAEFWEDGTIPWVASAAVNELNITEGSELVTAAALEQTSLKLYPKHTLLIALYGEGKTRGKVSELQIEATINQALAAIQIDAEAKQCRDFLKWFLHSNYEEMRRRAAGGMQPNLNLGVVKSIRVPLAPKAEQSRIVSAIKSLQERSSRARVFLSEVGPLIGQLRQSLLRGAFSGRLTAAWRRQNPDVQPACELLQSIREERRQRWEAEQLAKNEANGKKPKKNWQDKYKEPEPVDESELPELPEGWCWTNMEDLSHWAMYGPRFSSDAYENHGARVLRTTDFSEDGTVDLSTPPQIPLDEQTLEKYRVNEGDLLITRTGSLGTLAVFPGGTDSIAGAFLIHYRLLGDLGLSWWVFNYLKGPVGQKNLLEKGAGTGRQNLNMPRINSIPIPLAPEAEQSEILRRIDASFASIETVSAHQGSMESSLTQLDQSILSKAFRGELVPQDPRDEPASELLARIRTSREKLEAEKKANKKKAEKRKATKKKKTKA